MPYKFSFINDSDFPTWDYFELVIDIIFFFDIILNFFTAYFDLDENLVTSKKVS